MRRLLLAALGAAGSLLVDLPALAQLSNTTSTFSGQVAAFCSINLPENISLEYKNLDNSLMIPAESVELQLLSNLSRPRLVIDQLTVLNEPPAIASDVLASFAIWQGSGNSMTYISGTKNAASESKTFNVSPSVQSNLSIGGAVYTANMNNNSQFKLL